MFRIKICGVTSVSDARLCVKEGADAIGLNFYPGSRRFIERTKAEQIVAALPKRVAKVGVFVNEPSASVCDIADALELDYVQLHGDEPPEFPKLLGRRQIIRAMRYDRRGLGPLLEYLRKCQEIDRQPDMLLLDAATPGLYGGTGAVIDWSRLAVELQRSLLPSIILAGGLGPANVTRAIELVRPIAVDVASGVESAPGQKDLQALRSFIGAARAAFRCWKSPETA